MHALPARICKTVRAQQQSAFVVCAYVCACARAPRALCRTTIISTVHAVVAAVFSVLFWVEVLALPHQFELFPDTHPLAAFTTMTGVKVPGMEEYPPMSALHEAASAAMWLSRPHFASWAIGVTVGYMIFDLVYGLLVARNLEKAMIVHHVLVLLSYGVGGVVYGVGIPYQALFLINEASTPFVNVHFSIKSKGLVRTLNGLGMWLTYLLFRVVANTVLLASCMRTVTPHVWSLGGGLVGMYFFNFWIAQGECCYPAAARRVPPSGSPPLEASHACVLLCVLLCALPWLVQF
ncbi:hypothetical protein EON66_11265 [archaeon]|nr:MAG: hypothetical protein EON66_11265 [archaeon]